MEALACKVVKAKTRAMPHAGCKGMRNAAHNLLCEASDLCSNLPAVKKILGIGIIYQRNEEIVISGERVPGGVPLSVVLMPAACRCACIGCAASAGFCALYNSFLIEKLS
jgi:hypothetical protein